MILAQSVVERHQMQNAFIIGVLIVGLIAGWAIWMYARRTRPASRADYRKPGPASERQSCGCNDRCDLWLKEYQ